MVPDSKMRERLIWDEGIAGLMCPASLLQAHAQWQQISFSPGIDLQSQFLLHLSCLNTNGGKRVQNLSPSSQRLLLDMHHTNFSLRH